MQTSLIITHIELFLHMIVETISRYESVIPVVTRSDGYQVGYFRH